MSLTQNVFLLREGHSTIDKCLNALYPLSRLLISGLFLYAAASKLTDVSAFAETIFAFGFIPEKLAPIVAIGVLATEIIAGLLLAFDRRGGLLVLASLTMVFLAVLGYAIWAGLDVDCGCFGPNDPAASALESLRFSFVRNLVLLAIMAFIQWSRNHLNIHPKPFACFQ